MTQLEKVACVLHGRTLPIAAIARAAGMVEPSTRRVLGQGTLAGYFERVSAGVYKNTKHADAIANKMEECFKCGTSTDNVVLDSYGSPRPLCLDCSIRL